MNIKELMRKYKTCSVTDVIEGLELESEYWHNEFEKIKAARSYDDDFVEAIVEDNERQAQEIQLLKAMIKEA